MKTVTLSNTWRSRVGTGGRRARAAGIALVVLMALFGAAAGFKVFFTTAHPDDADVASIAYTVGNDRDLAAAKAVEFVSAWLTTPASRRGELKRFITIPDTDQTALTAQATATGQSSDPAPWVIDQPGVVTVVPKTAAAGLQAFAVTVWVNQRPYASAPAVRAYYRVPIGVWNFQARPIDWPAPMSDPGPGTGVKLGYAHQIDPRSAVYAVISGFASTYLTAAPGLDRYVMADSWIRPIAGYQSVVVKTSGADAEIPASPKPGVVIHVRATIEAQTPQFATQNFSLPLTLENSGGTWMVTNLDLVPQIDADGAATPAAGQPHN